MAKDLFQKEEISFDTTKKRGVKNLLVIVENLVVNFHVPLTPEAHRFEGGNHSANGGFCDGG